MWGLFAPSNFRLGFNYVPVRKFQLGFGFSKENLLWDFNAKYALIRQGRKGGSPVSLTYYANTAIDTRKKEKLTKIVEGNNQEKGVFETIDRFSFFHQLMVAR